MNITPKLQAEPKVINTIEVSPAGVHRYMKAYKYIFSVKKLQRMKLYGSKLL